VGIIDALIALSRGAPWGPALTRTFGMASTEQSRERERAVAAH
jgi:hypothetical protein